MSAPQPVEAASPRAPANDTSPAPRAALVSADEARATVAMYADEPGPEYELARYARTIVALRTALEAAPPAAPQPAAQLALPLSLAPAPPAAPPSETWPTKGITSAGHWGSKDGLAWERVAEGKLVVGGGHFLAGWIVRTPAEARDAMRKSRPRGAR